MVQTCQSRLTFLAADPSAAEGGWPRPERPALRLKTRVGGSRCGGGGQSPRRRRKALGMATGCKRCECKSASGQEYGVQTDPNGLLYMRARYYNPYISRFLNPDPSGFASGLNFYLFANGNPISNEDPFGLDPGYGNPISGPNGPIGPSDPYAPGGMYYVPYSPILPANYTAPNPSGMGTILFDSGLSYYAGLGGGGGTQIIQLDNGQIVSYGYAQIGAGLGTSGQAEGGGAFGAGQVYNVYQATDYEGFFSSVSGGAYMGGSISGQPLPGQNGAASYTFGVSTPGVSGNMQYYWIIGATGPTVPQAPGSQPSSSPSGK